VDIQIEHNPSKSKLQTIGVFDWPIWSKEESEFPWTYNTREICYIVEGKAEVTTEDGIKYSFGEGDLVTFSNGLSCNWNIMKSIRKHYFLE